MIYSDIQKLIDYSINNNLIEKADELVVRNQLMNALRVYDRALLVDEIARRALPAPPFSL